MKKPNVVHYILSAFSARPFGLWIPPNWIMLATFGFLGTQNPGFWMIGAGLELGYLMALVNNQRFQRTVQARFRGGETPDREDRWKQLWNNLGEIERQRYLRFEQRCRSILETQQPGASSVGLEALEESLGKLTWMYVRLLTTRRTIERLLRDALEPGTRGQSLTDRIADLKHRLAEDALSEEVRRSLTGQLEILEQRVTKQAEARDKLEYVDAEMTRIQEQVELIREQAVLSTDPSTISARIDEVAATLGGTAQWMSEQSQVLGVVEDLTSEAPPLRRSPGKVKQ